MDDGPGLDDMSNTVQSGSPARASPPFSHSDQSTGGGGGGQMSTSRSLDLPPGKLDITA